MKIFHLKISSCPFWDTCTYEGLKWMNKFDAFLSVFAYCLSRLKDVLNVLLFLPLGVYVLRVHRNQTFSQENTLRFGQLKVTFIHY